MTQRNRIASLSKSQKTIEHLIYLFGKLWYACFRFESQVHATRAAIGPKSDFRRGANSENVCLLKRHYSWCDG